MYSIHHRTGIQRGILSITMLVVLVASFVTGSLPAAHADEWFPVNPPAYLLADGNTAVNLVPPVIFVNDPDPARQNIHVPDEPEVAAAVADPSAAAATFSITYKAAGTLDPWDAPCQAFPEAAKTAINAAAAIWSATLQSSVPITVSLCWSNLTALGMGSTLGYSGGAYSYRNFTGAPKANTWYESSLANALHGSDLGVGVFDDYITYNSAFTWYYGTDGVTPAGQHDLESVVLHEIAHGLNFSGTADYSGGTGELGFSGSYNIYDTFMETGAGTKLTSLASPSAALGSALTSGNLWFNGPYAKAANTANGGARPKMYAPGSWSGGSSYSHLDYTTFAGTANSLMVYAIGSGSSQHNPGPVTKGLLKDLGWVLTSGSGGGVPKPQAPAGMTSDRTPTYKWSKVAGATQYRYQLYRGATPVYTKLVGAAVCSTTVCASTPATALPYSNLYKWRVQAFASGAWGAYSPFQTFTISPVPVLKAPIGTISDTTPTYKWTRISGATQYQYSVYKSGVLKYTKTVLSGSCGATAGICMNTPATVLTAGGYTWKARAYVGGVWRAWSAAKSFTIGSTLPKAGFFESTTGDEFYVVPTRNGVDNFAVYFTACGAYWKVTHLPVVPISSKKFAFTGAFYANGTFTTASQASGQDGLTNFYLPSPCNGTVSGGPWTYTAVWKDSSQPSGVGAVLDLVEQLDLPNLNLPDLYHTVERLTK